MRSSINRSDPLVTLARPRQRKPPILPAQKDRRHATLLLSKALNLKLEVYSLLESRAKNNIVAEALQALLEDDLCCDVAHSRVQPASVKRRITFVLTPQMDDQLSEFLSRKGCNKTCAVTAALMLFFQAKGIDPYVDPTPFFWQGLQTVPTTLDTW